MKSPLPLDITVLVLAFQARSPDAPARARLVKARYQAKVERAVEAANRLCAGADALMKEDAEADPANGAWRYVHGTEGGLVPQTHCDRARALYDEAFEALADAAPWQQAMAEVEEVERAYGTARLHREGSGMTAEMAVQLAVTPAEPVTWLFAKGHIDEDQRQAAREVSAIIRYVTSRVGFTTTYLPTAIEGGTATARRGYVETVEWFDLLHAMVYVPWSRRDPTGAALVVGIAHEGVSLSTLRTRHRMRWATALAKLQAALDLYNTMRGRYLQAGEGANGEASCTTAETAS